MKFLKFLLVAYAFFLTCSTNFIIYLFLIPLTLCAIYRALSKRLRQHPFHPLRFSSWLHLFRLQRAKGYRVGRYRVGGYKVEGYSCWLWLFCGTIAISSFRQTELFSTKPLVHLVSLALLIILFHALIQTFEEHLQFIKKWLWLMIFPLLLFSTYAITQHFWGFHFDLFHQALYEPAIDNNYWRSKGPFRTIISYSSAYGMFFCFLYATLVNYPLKTIKAKAETEAETKVKNKAETKAETKVKTKAETKAKAKVKTNPIKAMRTTIQTAIQTKITRLHYLLALTFVTTGVSLITTLTRGLYLALLVTIPTMALLKGWKFFITTVCAMALTALIAFALLPSLQKRTFDSLEIESEIERLVTWKAHFHLFLQEPLWGTGYRSSRFKAPKVYSPEKGKITSHAHNNILSILSGTGLVGLLCYLGFMTCFMLAAIQLYLKSSEPFWKTIGLGSTGAQIIFHVMGLVDVTFSGKCILLFLSIVALSLAGLKNLKSLENLKNP